MLPAESLWPTNLEGGVVSLCAKTWVFLNSLSQVFTNSAPNTVLQYQRQPGPTNQQPFVSKTSNPALQSRTAPLAPLQNGPSLASKVSHNDNSITTVMLAALQSCWLPYSHAGCPTVMLAALQSCWLPYSHADCPTAVLSPVMFGDQCWFCRMTRQ
jgi:hypothetical protein